MSLTGLLRDPASPAYAYLDNVSPLLRETRGSGDGARVAIETLRLGEIVNADTVVPAPAGVDAPRTGTAIDFRTRIALGGFTPRKSMAAVGLGHLLRSESQLYNGPHRARVLTEAFILAEVMLRESASEEDLDRAAIVFAHCEQIARAGVAVLDGSFGDACDEAHSGQAFIDGFDVLALADIRSLMEASVDQIDHWRAEIAGGDRFEPNPRLSGEELVGGADADWLIGDTLIDCKVYGSVTVSTLRGFLRQLLGYVMLDQHDTLGIRSVGIWLPRQQLTPRWRLDHLLGGDPEELLPVLREGFARAVEGQQVAVLESVPKRRGRQMLAENRYTPHHMLIELAQSDDDSIRARVARNSVTPEPVLRLLATDRLGRVREGVAMHPSAPADVLAALAHDRSTAVREAAAANPGMPRASLEAGRRPASPATQELVPAVRERDPWALDLRWLHQFLLVVYTAAPAQRSLLPLASKIWCWKSGRSLVVPDWPEDGLPSEVTSSLMKPQQPTSVRRLIASRMPLADPAIRTALLEDPDPEIRWSTLRSSRDHDGDDLGNRLRELAESRDARIRFRTKGLDRGERYTSTAEYDTETLSLVAAHPATPMEALRMLAQSRSPQVLAGLLANPSLDAADRESVVATMLVSRSVKVREELAASRSLTQSTADVLAGDRDVRVRRALAENGGAPPAALARLAADKDRSVRLCVLANRAAPADLIVSAVTSLVLDSTDAELHEALDAAKWRDDVGFPPALIEDALDRLSKSRMRSPDDMRVVVAEDERTGLSTLRRLAKSADVSVRSAVAANANAPAVLLEMLAADPDAAVRAAVAGNTATSAEVLATLAYDREPTVRARVARDPRLPAALLGELVRDDNVEVQGAALDNASTPPGLALRVEAARAYDKHVSRPSRAALMRLAASTHAEDRIWAAEFADTPPDILAFLAGQGRSVRVKRAVAAHPDAPAKVLWSLADAKDGEVQQALAFNSSTPRDLLAELASRSLDLALLVAMNPDTPMQLLDALTQDDEPLVRFVADAVRRKRQAS